MSDWHIFKGQPQASHDGITQLPPPPNWRPFDPTQTNPTENRRNLRADTFQVREHEIEMVNAALYLRRPLLITGLPGVGKSSLVYAVAKELQLGEVLYWPITTKTTLKDGLYNYDAIGRLQDVKQLEDDDEDQQHSNLSNIQKYITLGPLGTALLPAAKPRVLLIDEIDKSDIDLPNDLLTIFEEGFFEIPELVRIADQVPEATVRTAYTDEANEFTKADYRKDVPKGRVICRAFPFVVLTSNGERDFPAPFLRRCLRLRMEPPTQPELEKIVRAHFNLKADEELSPPMEAVINTFLKLRKKGVLATDQLLNAMYIVTHGRRWRKPAVGISQPEDADTEADPNLDKDWLIQQLLKHLDRGEGG